MLMVDGLRRLNNKNSMYVPTILVYLFRARVVHLIPQILFISRTRSARCCLRFTAGTVVFPDWVFSMAKTSVANAVRARLVQPLGLEFARLSFSRSTATMGYVYVIQPKFCETERVSEASPCIVTAYVE